VTRLLFIAALALMAARPAGADGPPLDFGDAERRAILRHGPWPAPWSPDPSNRVSGKPAAIEFGERLFFEPRLSPSGKVLCATCHVPYRGWQDARARAFGLVEVERNTPSLYNLRYNRWFGWDGAGDSPWAQSIRPILDAREMGGSKAQAAALVRGDAELACRYRNAFGVPPSADDERLLADIGKALAAFQETIVSGRAPFDDFRDALEKDDRAAAGRYPLAAQRGLRLFVGRGKCSVCHFGPAFSNGEFHDTGVPFFTAGGADPGRHGGIRKLLANPYNLLGQYNDEPRRGERTAPGAVKTRHVSLEHRNFGEFKVPGLRNVALTAPYMHNGSIPTLPEVVRHYSEISPDRLHSDGESLLKALHLDAGESADLVAFLESLSETASALAPRLPGAPCH